MRKATSFAGIVFLFAITFISTSYSSEYEGFGAGTPGGSGQQMYRVTNLRDSGPGSLRDAVSRGRRYVVFDVAGEINLSSRIHVTGSYVTIDGFTAPHPGITLKGWGLYMWGNQGAHNIIIRGIRVRNSAGDGLHVSKGAHDVVIDRSSVAFAGDGNIDITEGAYNVTVSRTILAEPASGNKNMLIMYDSPRRITLYQNLFIKAESRSPQVQTDGFGTPATDTTVDMRNNVIWDWRGGYGSRLRYGPRVNVINNYYAANGGDARDALVVCPGPECDDSNPASAARVYAKGNISAEGIDLDARGNESVAFPAPPVGTLDAKSGACEVFTKAGVRPLDSLDQHYLSMLSLRWCSEDPDPEPAPIPPPPVPVPEPRPANYRVNSGGGKYLDANGHQWSADQAYRPGAWGYLGGSSYRTSASIGNTADDSLYQSERYGNFTYLFDVPNGLYDVTLHFAEIYWNGANQRKFNVRIEGGALVLDRYDIYAVNGKNNAIGITFSGIRVADAQLNINFLTVQDNAKVSAIWVRRSSN
jgi:pectate lyase